MQEIPREHADQDLNQRHRNAGPNRHETGGERQTHPNRRDKPNILNDSVRATEADPKIIEHNKTPVRTLLRQQESLALKPVRRFSLFWERQTPLPPAEGIDVLTFLAGAEIDPRSLKTNLRASALIGIIS